MNNNWIKVDEQLPETNVPVFAGWFSVSNGEFVWHKFVRYRVCGLGGWLWFKVLDMRSDISTIIDDDYPITHWMPLLSPPMPEGE